MKNLMEYAKKEKNIKEKEKWKLLSIFQRTSGKDYTKLASMLKLIE